MINSLMSENSFCIRIHDTPWHFKFRPMRPSRWHSMFDFGWAISIQWSKWLLPWHSIPQACAVEDSLILFQEDRHAARKTGADLPRFQAQLSIYLRGAMMSFVRIFRMLSRRAGLHPGSIPDVASTGHSRSCILLGTTNSRASNVHG